MRESRINVLAKSLARPTPRRSVLAGFLGAIFGGRIRVGEAAGCRSVGRVCRENADCCSGNCTDRDSTGRRYCGCSVEGQRCNPSAEDCCDKALVCAGNKQSAVCRTNSAPFAFNQTFSGPRGSSCIGVWMNGRDPDGDPLTLHVRSKPRFGLLADRDVPGENETNRALCYQPSALFFNNGLDRFTYTASDPYGKTSPPATITVVVSGR
ncbi:MAG: hypothetical protein QOF33_1746 [Thermomicrobiales bacterium]|jgi:hypothetical protein|nr:hypothetical protein [Thermomicrobiales bacterium]MEA2583661.1 hypothetical protein [Thermomicrobiales bacterium]